MFLFFHFSTFFLYSDFYTAISIKTKTNKKQTIKKQRNMAEANDITTGMRQLSLAGGKRKACDEGPSVPKRAQKKIWRASQILRCVQKKGTAFYWHNNLRFTNQRTHEFLSRVTSYFPFALRAPTSLPHFRPLELKLEFGIRCLAWFANTLWTIVWRWHCTRHVFPTPGIAGSRCTLRHFRRQRQFHCFRRRALHWFERQRHCFNATMRR